MLTMTEKQELRLGSHNHAAQSSLNAYRKSIRYRIRYIHAGVTLQRISRYRAFLEQKNSGSSGVRTASQHPHNLHELLNIISLNPFDKLLRRLLCLAAPKAQHAPEFGAGRAQLPYPFQPVLSILGFPRGTASILRVPRAFRASQVLSVIQVAGELLGFQFQPSLGWEVSLEVAEPTPAPSRAHFRGGSGSHAECLSISRIPQSLFLVFDHVHFSHMSTWYFF